MNMQGLLHAAGLLSIVTVVLYAAKHITAYRELIRIPKALEPGRHEDGELFPEPIDTTTRLNEKEKK